MADQNNDTTERGSTQITLPYIESGMRINGILLKKLAFLVPALVPLGASVLWNFFTSDTSSFRLTIPATGILVAVFWLLAKSTSWEFHHPRDYLSGFWRRWFGSLRRFPLSHEELVSDAEHGYARIYDSGIGERQDGQFIAFVRAASRNTDKTTASEQNKLVLKLTSAIRRNLDSEVRLFQTTFDTDDDDLEKWRSARYDRFAGSQWRYARRYLSELLKYEQKSGEAWDARDRQTYFVVTASPSEVRKRSTADDTGVGERVKSSISGSGELTAYQRKQLEQLVRKRAGKAERVARSVTDTEDGDIELVGPGEHALLISKYWCGVEPNFDNFRESDRVALSVWPDIADYAREKPAAGGDYGAGMPDLRAIDQEFRRTSHRPVEVEDRIGEAIDPHATAQVGEVEAISDGGEVETQTVKDSTAGPELPEKGTPKRRLAEIREGLFSPDDAGISESVTQERLAASHYDVDDGYIEVGEQLCKSYWLTSFRKEPASNFLEALQNLQGVDYDLTIRASSPVRSDAIDHLEEKIENTDASIEERRESRDPETGIMSDEVDYYIDMYGMLKKSSARPWWLNAYVTVRVGPKQAFEAAEEDVVEGFGEETSLSEDMAKKRALDDATEKLVDAIENEPAAMAPITSKARADLLFESAFPASRDTYNESTKREKRSLTLSGTLAATYPFATGSVQEESGLIFGRNIADKQRIVADPFARDGAPHRLTGGRSGSGKTFFVGDQSLLWWMAGDPPESAGTERESESELETETDSPSTPRRDEHGRFISADTAESDVNNGDNA